MLSSGMILEGRSQFLGGFLACLFARLFAFALLFSPMVRLAVLAIEELLGILVESRLISLPPGKHWEVKYFQVRFKLIHVKSKAELSWR